MSAVRTADQDSVRRVNKSIVLNTIRLRAPISRAEVANLTGLNRSTVSNIVNSLIDEGLDQPIIFFNAKAPDGLTFKAAWLSL